MLIGTKTFDDVSMEDVMSPAMRTIWDHMSIGVAIVDGEGTCVYMNEIQARVDGFTTSGVVGKHITELYVPNGMARIPTMECLYRGEPLLRKAYWYKTINNSLFSSVTDFYSLFDEGRKDGVLAFTIWVDSALLTGEAKMNTRPPVSASENTRYTFENIIGHDPALRGAINDAKVAAKSPVPVMIWGENGTGKELFAQALHAASPRKDNPFVAVNCAAIPENLLEGILFGTSKGAYTDAAYLKRPTAAPCCSTSSTPCLSVFSPSFCASFRKKGCAGSEPARKKTWMSGSSAFSTSLPSRQ